MGGGKELKAGNGSLFSLRFFDGISKYEEKTFTGDERLFKTNREDVKNEFFFVETGGRFAKRPKTGQRTSKIVAIKYGDDIILV